MAGTMERGVDSCGGRRPLASSSFRDVAVGANAVFRASAGVLALALALAELRGLLSQADCGATVESIFQSVCHMRTVICVFSSFHS